VRKTTVGSVCEHDRKRELEKVGIQLRTGQRMRAEIHDIQLSMFAGLGPIGPTAPTLHSRKSTLADLKASIGIPVYT
jgi:hypothetical protein